ncbi:S9 family peptidase [Streptomyces musisoli]|uniref:S9 family peptidase n=1 Tax=Streptomyces musisoli TaxID=2802280 RepID=UPI001F40EED6|nr:prolyl oligopeptidase family serine peptidase [Streptomyces musisoli]
MASDTRNLTEERAAHEAAGPGTTVAGVPTPDASPEPPAPDGRGPAFAAPARIPLPDAAGPRDAPTRLVAHGCWYPSADPAGVEVAYICDRGGVPQLWVGSVDGAEVRLLDTDPDPVQEVSWSPDGRWIAYSTAPGGGEHLRVLCVRPDGTDRHILAGAEPGSSAHLGCWAHDGSAIAVTVAVPTAVPVSQTSATEPGPAEVGLPPDRLSSGRPRRDGDVVILGAAPHDEGGLGWPAPAAAADVAAPAASWEGHPAPTPGFGDGLSAYLIDPEGVTAPVLLAAEKDAATLRVCDLSRDGDLALLRRGPRGRREAVVLRIIDRTTTCVVPVADGDPWIGRFSPHADTIWLRSDAYREFAVLLAAELDPDGQPHGWYVAASREDSDLELLHCAHDGSTAVLAWNVRGMSEVEVLDTRPPAPARTATHPPGPTGTVPHPSGASGTVARPSGAAAHPSGPTGTATYPSGPTGTATYPSGPAGTVPHSSGPARTVPHPSGSAGTVTQPFGAAGAVTAPPRPLSLPHEVATRIVDAGPGLVLALSGSQRRPGLWWLSEGTALLRTQWSSRDEDAVPPGRSPVRPLQLGLTARDGLPLNGWYYRAPGRGPGEPAPCVIYLHGGPEDQERPVLNPLYHEILGRGLDIFAPDVRGSSGYGRSFVDADLGRGRFAAIDDVADCAAQAVLSGPADPSRLAVMGRSYGGYLTFASLVWHPDLFRTGVAVCGMSDFATFFEGTEPWIAQSAAHKYGHPERDRELLHALSPMSRIDALRAPVLAVHGEHDTNVPPGESEQFVRAARERGLTGELFTLRDEGHDFLRADNRRLFRRTAADWLQRHLTG